MDPDTMGSWTAESYGRYECRQHGARVRVRFHAFIAHYIFIAGFSVRVMDISRISFDVYAAETPAAGTRFPTCPNPQHPNYLESIKAHWRLHLPVTVDAHKRIVLDVYLRAVVLSPSDVIFIMKVTSRFYTAFRKVSPRGKVSRSLKTMTFAKWTFAFGGEQIYGFYYIRLDGINSF